ncbi:hypothetical protein PMAYCL1PPCAC_10701, partial [Pristionchus mayeri]
MERRREEMETRMEEMNWEKEYRSFTRFYKNDMEFKKQVIVVETNLHLAEKQVAEKREECRKIAREINDHPESASRRFSR